jgi:uncharacterized UBP type Zn finger protein
VTPALTQLERWFSEEEHTRCPSCDVRGAIQHGSVLVCLACAAVSLGRSKPIGVPGQGS